jgi:hypothetical protein
MPLKLAAAAGISLIFLPSIALALSPTATLISGSEASSALVLVQAQPDPTTGAHAAIGWAKGRLSEMDATIKALEDNASKLDADARKRADETLQTLRASRDAYRAKIAETLADARQQTDAQIADTRATLEARWNDFEHDLGGYLDKIDTQVTLRQAVFDARVKAEELYWQQTIAELKTSASSVAAEQRAAIEAEIAQLQASADAAKARLAKLEQAGTEASSALSDALTDARQLFDKTQDTVRAAIKHAQQ